MEKEVHIVGEVSCEDIVKWSSPNRKSSLCPRLTHLPNPLLIPGYSDNPTRLHTDTRTDAITTGQPGTRNFTNDSSSVPAFCLLSLLYFEI